MKKVKISIIIILFLSLFSYSVYANTIVELENEITETTMMSIQNSEKEEILPNGIYKIYSKLSTNRLIEAPNNSRSQKHILN